MYGYVHSIETAGMVDGKGIRYVLFLQGCVVNCIYCHNPDTLGNINKGKKMTVNEVVTDILRYKPFIKNGGVTISGGEPLLQNGFTLEILKKLKQNNIHTAIDTSGCVDFNLVKNVFEYVDLILLDIKHERTIGLNFANYIRNLFKYLELSEHKEMWIRQVIIKDLTDEVEVHESWADILSFYDIARVELLPFHNMAKHKWEQLGYEYKMSDKNIPTKEKMKELIKIYRQYGLNVL